MPKVVPALALLATLLAGGAFGASRPVRPVGVVADPSFPRERIRACLGADVRFFAASDLAAIRAFSAKGGRLVVAYCGDAELGRFMGVKPGPWRKLESVALGSGSSILCNYRTGCAFVPAVPPGNPLHARVTATLRDSWLRDTGIPGAIETDRGVWYAHAVPPSPMRPGPLPRLPGALRVRGVWSAGAPLDPRGWAATAGLLVARGFNTVFLRVDAPDFSAVASSCRRAGLQVHAWMPVFESGGRSPARKADVDAAVRAAAALAARRDIDGIQFDYIRYASGAGGSSAVASAHMRDVSSALLRMSRAVRARNPRLTLSAAVYPVPRTQQSVGQNAAQWLRLKMVDFVSPMCYTTSVAEFSGWLAENLAVLPASQLVVGIGSGANESRLDAAGIASQLDVALARRLRGAALFALDAELMARLREGAAKKR